MVLSDVTRVKELEREKSKVKRLISLGELAAGMAHEIKNPLASIKTFAELLPSKYDDHEFRHKFSEIVRQEIERINKLVVELLNFSRIPKPSLEMTDIKVVMDEVLLLLFPQLSRQKIRLQKFYHEELPLLEADRDQLKQALLNICLNAVQAMPGGGNLSVDIFLNTKEPAGNSTGTIKILIKDTGIGIAPHQEERVFDPFFTTKTEGVGIGLSVSHQIISDHGGTIKFKSEYKETVFEITLPVACPEGSEADEVAYSTMRQGQHAPEN
jgi:two-component system sensor histidine kinase AtoS